MLISIACSGYKPSPGHPFFAHAAGGEFSSPEKQLWDDCTRLQLFSKKLLPSKLLFFWSYRYLRRRLQTSSIVFNINWSKARGCIVHKDLVHITTSKSLQHVYNTWGHWLAGGLFLRGSLIFKSSIVRLWLWFIKFLCSLIHQIRLWLTKQKQIWGSKSIFVLQNSILESIMLGPPTFWTACVDAHAIEPNPAFRQNWVGS